MPFNNQLYLCTVFKEVLYIDFTVSVVLLPALGYKPHQIRDFMLSFTTRFGLLPAANGKLFF